MKAAGGEENLAADCGRLKITEVFLSLQGETALVGWPTVFIRLTGCPLRCQYCDTAYAFHGGSWIGAEQILAEVARHSVKHVCVTGGEPLAQKNCLGLLRQLCDAGYVVSLETGGSLDISAVDSRVIRILDIKTPGSGESARNLWPNLEHLNARDQVKFVICNRADYEWSREVMSRHQINARCTVLFSASHGVLEHRALADWIVADRLPARFQIQMHKFLWGGEPGR